MKRLYIFIFLLINSSVFGQNWQWIKQMLQSPTPNLDNEISITDVKTVSSGNLYVVGIFKSNFTIDGINYVGNPINTYKNVFIIKMNSNGKTLWVNIIKGDNTVHADAMDFDNSENIYISGLFLGTCNWGGSCQLTSTGDNDAFIAKYDSSGTIQWAIPSAYGTNNERTTALTIGNDGKIYVAGISKSSSFTVGDGSNGDIYTNTDGITDLFLACYQSNGTYSWSEQIPGDNDKSIFRAITVDNSNNVYVGGALLGTLTIGGTSYTSSGNGDIILVKASSVDGSVIWVRKGGSPADDQLNSIITDDDYTYIAGYIQGTGTIDSTATLQSSTFTTEGGNDIFVAKYNREGRLLWKESIGSTGNDVGYGLRIKNNILVSTGYFSHSIDFNLNTIISNPADSIDAAFFVFDESSNPVLAKSVSGTYGNIKFGDRGQGIAVDDDYNVYFGGYFTSPTLTAGTNSLTNSASGYQDGFITKYHNEFVATFTYKKNASCSGGADGELTVTPYFGTPPYTYSWTLNGSPYAATDSTITNLSAGNYQVTVTDNNSNVSTVSYTVIQPAAISISATQTNASCYNSMDGAIDITTSGGTIPYSYFWTTSDGCGHNINTEDQTGLSAGTYQVEVTDNNGCTSSESYTLTQPSQIQINGSVTNISGAGSNGAVDITVTGGSGTYSNYSWIYEDTEIATSEDITGITSGGDYKIVVTDNTFCKDSNTFAVLDERVFHGWVSSQTNISCNGGSNGSATISYAENIGAVTISWSSGETTFTISGKPAGTYTATLTDDLRTGDTSDDVTDIVTVTLTEPNQPLNGAITAYNTSCYGGNDGMLDLTPSGGTLPYSYSWNTSPIKTTQDINELLANDYTVTITDANGCTKDVLGTVSQPNEISFSFLSTQPSCYNSATGELSVDGLIGGTAPYEYLWSNTLTTSTISNIKGGNYWLKVTDSNGCNKTNSTSLGQPTDITINHSENKPTCPESKDGSIGLTVSGGTPVYTYHWVGPDIISATDKDQTNLGPGTYTVTVTDANLCTKDYQVELISENPDPTVDLVSSDADNTICIGDNVIFTASGGSTYEFFLNGSPVQGPGAGYSYSNSSLINGDQVFATVTTAAGCSANTSTITTTVNALPTVNANTSANPVCEGDPVTLTGSGAVSYSWDNDVTDGIEFYPSATDTYTVTGTDANGCINTDQITITVNPSPVASINTSDQLEYCDGDAISTLLEASPSDGSYYQWSRNAESISGANSSTYTATQDGFYSVYVIKNGCVGISDDVEITVHPLPSVSLTDLSPVCVDASPFSLTGGTPENGIYSGEGVTDGSFDPSSAGAGIHSITYTYTDVNGCTNFDSKDITVNELPSVTLADFSPVCVDATPITLTGGSPEGGVYSGTGVSDGIFDPATAGVGTHTITYTYTDGNSCVNYASKDITVNGLPTVTLTDFSPVCIDAAPITLTGGSPEGGVYSGTGVSDGIFDPTTAGVGTHTITYTYTDGNSCVNYASKDITVNGLPTITLADFNPVCIDAAPITLTGGLPEGGVYSGTGVSDGIFDPATAGVGTHTITYTYTDGNSCVNYASKDITVNGLPTVTLTGLSPVCSNADPYTLTEGSPSGGVYSGTGVTGNSFDPSISGTGTFTITYTYTDSNGCINQDSKDITVNPLPTANITTTNPTTWCEGSTINVNITADAADTYQWLLNSSPLTGETSQTLNASSTGTYSVEATTNGCSAIGNSIEIIEVSTPTITIETSDPITWCEGDNVSVALSANPSGGESYQWIKDGTDIASATQSTYNTTKPGSYTVAAVFAGGCNATSDAIVLTQNPSPSVDIASDTIKIDTQSSYTFDAGEGFTSYLWNDNSTSQTLLVDGANTGEGVFKYWVTVTNEYSCSATDTAVVKVNLWKSVPTKDGWKLTIYPNPSNGNIKLKASGITPGNYHIAVYNSLGQLVDSNSLNFSNTDIEEPINLSHLPKGFYYMNFGNDKQTITIKFIIE
ncbi:MAG: T9SS type A sorting domain-containing protein [Bacteroidales bacterium]|nr:T9SS type A sorting domain-containing protein [Bacteroidales bacterium]